MAENKELKPKSFRIDDATADKFKEISSQIGGNQQETLAKLIEAYEFQSGKVVLMDKKADIEQFESYVSCMTRMYMSSLEDNQNITETVRSQFEALLKSKDCTIQDLQLKLSMAKEKERNAVQESRQKTDEVNVLAMELEKLKSAHADEREHMSRMLADKEELNRALADSCSTLKAKLTETEQVQEQVKKLKKAEKEVSELKIKLERQQLEYERAQLELEKAHNAELAEIKQKHTTDIEHYQAMYKGLLSELHKMEQKTD